MQQMLQEQELYGLCRSINSAYCKIKIKSLKYNGTIHNIIMKLIIMNFFIAVVTGCSNVRVDANIKFNIAEQLDTDQHCSNCDLDSSTTSFQARTMELDRKLFHGSSSSQTNKTEGITLLPSYVQTFPTSSGKEIVQECSPYIEWKWEQTIPAVGITYGGSLLDKSLRSLTDGMNSNGLNVSVQLYRGNQFPRLSKMRL